MYTAAVLSISTAVKYGGNNMSNVLRAQTNRLLVTRADSASFPLTINKLDGTNFIPEKTKGEKVTFTVRNGPKADEYPVLIQKDITGTRIDLEPADTQEMDYGSYFFDIEAVWTDDDGELATQTVIKGQFVVLVEAT